MATKCSIDDCTRLAAARTWCRPHWKRWKRNGAPTASAIPKRIPAEVRFAAKVARLGPDDCWEWTAARNEWNYGLFRLEPGKTMKGAHRVAWMFANGPIPEGLSVCHKCDNPGCCNPAHLFVDTHQGNMRDRNEKGRTTLGRTGHHGEGSGRSAKLKLDQVEEIRRRYAAGGVSQSALGLEFGVSQTEVSRITRGTRWYHDIAA